MVFKKKYIIGLFDLVCAVSIYWWFMWQHRTFEIDIKIQLKSDLGYLKMLSEVVDIFSKNANINKNSMAVYFYNSRKSLGMFVKVSIINILNFILVYCNLKSQNQKFKKN